MALKWGISFPDVLLKGQQKKIKFGLLGNRRSSSSLIHKKTPRGSFLSSSGETMLKAQPATVFLQISLFLQISSFYKFHFNKTCSPSPQQKMNIYIYNTHSSYHWKNILPLWKSTLLPCHVAKGWNLRAEDSLLSQSHRLASGSFWKKSAWETNVLPPFPFPLFSTRKVWMCGKFRNTQSFCWKKMANLRINLLSAWCPKFLRHTHPKDECFLPWKKSKQNGLMNLS